MSPNNVKITKYNLSLEELSLAMSLITRPDLTQALMRSIYPDLSSKQMDVRLKSAGNSLLARGLCQLSDRQFPQLDEEFAKALFLIASYDYLLEIAYISKNSKNPEKIHIQQNKYFTSHASEKGIVHKLKTGKISSLDEYLVGYFNGIGKESPQLVTGKVTIDTLNMASKDKRHKKEILNELERLGWSDETLQHFYNAITQPVHRGIISKLNLPGSATIEEAQRAPQSSIMVIQGKIHGWLIEFSGNGSDEGKVTSYTKKAFHTKLRTLL